MPWFQITTKLCFPHSIKHRNGYVPKKCVDRLCWHPKQRIYTEVNKKINVVHLSELEDLRKIPLQSIAYEPCAYGKIPLLIIHYAYSSHPCGNASMYSRVSIVLLLRTWTLQPSYRSLIYSKITCRCKLLATLITERQHRNQSSHLFISVKKSENQKNIENLRPGQLACSHVLKASQRLKLNDKPSNSPVFGSFCKHFGVYNIMNDQQEREVYKMAVY